MIVAVFTKAAIYEFIKVFDLGFQMNDTAVK